MQKIVLMYHAVSGATPGVTGSVPVPMERFMQHVLSLRDQGWTFGRLSQLHEPVDRPTAYLTSDDGTLDWAENVLPWCEEQRLPTHTAVISGPWLDPPRYPTAHRVQVLLSLPGAALPQPCLTASQKAYVDRVYSYETDPVRRYLKGACNVVLDEDQAWSMLGPPSGQELRHLQRRFASPTQYRRFAWAEVGVHTVTHQAYAGNPAEYLAAEILACRRHLREAGLEPSPIFSLPMRPRFPADSADLVKPLQRHGFIAMLEGLGRWDGRSYVVPRIDARDIESVFGRRIPVPAALR